MYKYNQGSEYTYDKKFKLFIPKYCYCITIFFKAIKISNNNNVNKLLKSLLRYDGLHIFMPSFVDF